jgi:hypothetical protein
MEFKKTVELPSTNEKFLTRKGKKKNGLLENLLFPVNKMLFRAMLIGIHFRGSTPLTLGTEY